MPATAATHEVGPDRGSLRVRTGRAGAAARAGHDLLLEVTDWRATVTTGPTPSVTLTADPGSVQVIEGTGGVKALSAKDKEEISGTITAKVLGTSPITFASSDVRLSGTTWEVTGELRIAGRSRPVSVSLHAGADGAVGGSVTVRQSDFGIPQYKAMLGALKVADEVQVQLAATLPAA